MAMITVKEAATLLRIQADTIRRLIRNKQLKAYRIPATKKWLIDKDELQNFFVEKCVNTHNKQ